MKLQKDSLRIMIYSDHFYPSLGGSENYALDLATELTRQGHSVAVVTAQKEFDADTPLFQIFRLRKPFSLYRVNLNFIELPKIIKEFQPDILHINYQTGGENLLIPLLKVMRMPFIITYHADHLVTLGRMIDELQLVSTFRCAKFIMIQSKRDEKKFKSRGFPKEKLFLSRFNGIDTEKYKCVSKGNRNENSIKLLCIARLDDSHKYKGIHELIMELRGLNIIELPFKLSINIIGDGNLREQYENECCVYHLSNISFLGNVGFEQMIKEICDADFLILPSIDKAEGFGRVALESLSCGTPVIVSKYAGIAELIEKYNAGIVYDPRNLKGLIYTIASFLYSRQGLQQLAENGKTLITGEKLSLTLTTEKTTQIYYKSLGMK